MRELTERWSAGAKTYVAVLAAVLAGRVAYPTADLTRLKKGEGAFHLRGAADAIAAIRGTIGLNLGANGLNPLNNGAFQGPESLADVAVRQSNRAKFKDLSDAVTGISKLSVEEARHALRAFVQARTVVVKPLETIGNHHPLSLGQLVALLQEFVASKGDQGARAQCVAAGIMGAAYGDDRVLSRPVHDPDLGFPGDVALLENGKTRAVVEVRDKSVKIGELLTFIEKVSERSISRASILGVAQGQDNPLMAAIERRASETGVFVRFFPDWQSFAVDCIANGAYEPSVIIAKIPQRVLCWAQVIGLPPKSVSVLKHAFLAAGVAH